MEKLRQIAKQANINLPTTSDVDGGDGGGDGVGEEKKRSGEAAAAAEAGVLRGVNEVLRFVQALDRVDTEGVEPMWTPLRQSHAAPLRSDEVAGKRKKKNQAHNDAAAAKGGDGGGLAGAAAEEGEAGWRAAARDDLLHLAPDSSKSPHYVSPKTAGTEDS